MRAIAILLTASGLAHAAPMAAGKAKIELGVRKPKYFLGENVLVDFCVVNIGTTPITIGVGGDYRGSSRALRFKVDVLTAAGGGVSDPDPNPMNFGGLGYSPTIEPGKKWCESLPLLRYARITAPGTYTIKATHDLEWPAGTAPTGTAKITFAMPNAAEAENVIAAMEALPKDSNRSAGQVSIDYQDYSTLVLPPYLAPLAARADKGSLEAVTGITFMPTVSATRALVKLIQHADRKIAQAATRGLAMRLPDPALSNQLGARNPFEDSQTDQRKYLSQAWDPQLADDVRAAGRKRLASTDVDDQRDGAFILEALGLPGDAPELVKALDVALDRTRTVPAEDGIYPVPRGAMMELLRATRMLVQRGLKTKSPTTPGELAVLLVAIHEGASPAGWEAELDKGMKHSISYVRELALRNTPDQVPPSLIPAITANLASLDPDVVVAAAELAARGKLVQLTADVVKAMKRPTGLRLNIVSYAAYQLGARWDRIQMLITRLSDKTAFNEALGELCDVLAYNGRGSDGEPSDAERAAVIPRWKKLVAAHRTEIENDSKIPLTTSDVTPKLLPPQWKLTRPTGGQWP